VGAALYTEHPNKYTYIIPERPSFTADGHTEKGGEYIVAVWQKGWMGETLERRLWWKHLLQTEEPLSVTARIEASRESIIARAVEYNTAGLGRYDCAMALYREYRLTWHKANLYFTEASRKVLDERRKQRIAAESLVR
jgi:hypothetical protein